MSESMRCKRCELPALPDRKLCQAHSDMQKVYQSNYQKKKAGGNAKKESTKALVPAKSRAGEVVPKVAVTRILPASDLVTAIVQVRDDLNVLERALTIIERLKS